MFDNSTVNREWMDIDRLAEELGVKKSWIYDQTHRGKIPHRKLGGKLRFSRKEIEAWIFRQPGCSLTSGSLLHRKE